MSIGKRLISTGAGGVTPSCTTDTTDIFDDSSGIALYSLDYDASTAPDATTDYSGTPSNVEFGTDGQINWGARFNGSSSNIQIPTTATTPFDASSEDFAISLWVNINNFGNDDAIINKWGSSTSLRSYWLGLGTSGSNNKIYIYEQSSSVTTFASTTTLNASQWHHIVYVRNATQLLLYIDNVLQTFSATNAINQGGTETLAIGQQLGFSGNTLDGSIDQVRIFNTALDSSKVGTLYAETACVYTGTTQSHLYGCLANYNLDNDAKEAMGVTAYDGTESNITYQFGRFGTAAVFNGSSSYISGLNGVIPATTTDCTFSCWFNMSTGFSSNFESILGGTGVDSLRITINYSSSGNYKIQPGRGRSSNAFYSSSNWSATAISPKLWYHLVCVYTNSTNTMDVYLNNNLIDSEVLSTTTSSAVNTNLVLGYYRSDVGFSYWNGSIDQVRIFGSALTTTQVAGLFNDEKQAYITKSASDPFGDSSEVAFYKMENNADDSTGSNNGSASNVTFSTTDALFDSYSAVFNGSSSYISTGINFSTLTNTKSISMWIKSTGSSSVGFGGMDGSYGNNGLFAFDESGGNVAYIPKFGGYHTGDASTVITNAWNHFVVTDTNVNGNVKIYINGSEVTVTKVNSTVYVNNTNMQIGRQMRNNGTAFWHTGTIDQVRIFNRVLEGDEVFKLYAEVIN